jgi:gliding motility-associated-like protein
MGTGSYQVRVFDGSCAYTTSFIIPTHVFSPTLSPSSVTLCPGGGIAAGIVFSIPPSLSQYTYSWTPNLFLAGNTQQSTILIPNLAVGTQSNITYSVVITPTAINCPMTRTLNLWAINPPTPTLSLIPNLCNNSSPYQIIASPAGGVFTGVGVSTLGVVSPTVIGVNSYTYAISISTCAASNTGSYEVSYFNTSALTGSINNLCVTGSAVNLMGIVQNTTGVWSGAGVSSGSFSPAGLNTAIYNITYNTSSTPNPTVCPSSTQLNISVTNTVIPTMASAGPFCNNTASFVLAANPVGGTWSNNSAVSSLGIVTPSLSSPSSSIVGYMVQVGPCVNTNTFAIFPSTYNTASLTGVVPNMCVTNNQFNLMSIVQNTTGTWSGMSISQNAFNPAGLGTGSYVLTYNTNSTPNTTICPDSRTITVSVLNPPVPNITSVGPVCSSDALIQMSVAPSTGSWMTTPYLNLNGVLTPSLCSIGNNLIQYVIGTNTCSSQQTKTVTVEIFVPSTISSQLPDMCNTGSAVNLNAYASFPGSWSGFGITGSMFNPYTSGAGTITLIHTTSSTSGLCPSTSTTSVRVYSLAAPSITKPTRVCNTQPPFQLQVTPLGGLFGSSNGVSLSGLFTPAYAGIGSSVVNYSIAAGPCIAYAQTTVTVEKFISAQFDKYPKSVYCRGSEFPFNLNSLVQNPGYAWSGPGVVGTMFHPNLANIGANQVRYITTSTTPSLCPDSRDIIITVAATPTISIAVDKLKGCAPFTNILSIDKNSGTADWIFDRGLKSKRGLSTSQTFTGSGLYTAHVNYMSTEGCATIYTAIPTFTVYEKPVAKFSVPSVVSIAEPQVQIENQTSSMNDHYYNWSILNTQYSVLNPTVNFTKPGKYEIRLEVTSFAGCKDTLMKTIEVKGAYNVWIPSSFTPNFDGVNDIFIPVFSPYGIDTKHYEFTIFNRWGALLFNTSNINAGWDGTYKGEPVIEAVYVFTLKFKDSDGVVYDKIGHVTLLR